MAVLCAAQVAQPMRLPFTQNAVGQTAGHAVNLRVVLTVTSRALTAAGGRVFGVSVPRHMAGRAVVRIGEVLVGEAEIIHLVPVVHLVPCLITLKGCGREGSGVFHGNGCRVHGPREVFHADHVEVDDAAEERRCDGVSPGNDHAGSVGLGWLGVAHIQDGEDEEGVPEDQEGDHHQQHHHHFP